jgi:hypothetical protein
MPKPFGKPIRRNLGLTRAMRLTFALWGAAIPAFFLCRWASRGYPTLSESPFFGPSILGFGIFYALAIAFWLRRRPSPRGPWESSRAKLFIVRLLLGLLAAAPAALISAYLYEPAFKLANGLASPGRTSVEYALVDREGPDAVLDFPYYTPGYRWKVQSVFPVPKDLPRGSLARVTIRRGILGARWIDGIEYQVLK